MAPNITNREQTVVETVLAQTENLTVEARAVLIKALEKQQIEGGEIPRTAVMPTVERPDPRAIIAVLKREYGMTNRDIAAATGKGLGTIGRISSGETVQPRLDVLESLSALLRKMSAD